MTEKRNQVKLLWLQTGWALLGAFAIYDVNGKKITRKMSTKHKRQQM
jgi:hypothetical protein